MMEAYDEEREDMQEHGRIDITKLLNPYNPDLDESTYETQFYNNVREEEEKANIEEEREREYPWLTTSNKKEWNTIDERTDKKKGDKGSKQERGGETHHLKTTIVNTKIISANRLHEDRNQGSMKVAEGEMNMGASGGITHNEEKEVGDRDGEGDGDGKGRNDETSRPTQTPDGEARVTSRKRGRGADTFIRTYECRVTEETDSSSDEEVEEEGGDDVQVIEDGGISKVESNEDNVGGNTDWLGKSKRKRRKYVEEGQTTLTQLWY